MLKLISSSCIHRLNPAAVPVLRPASDSASPLLRVLHSLGGLSRSNRYLGGRLFFCSESESGDGPDHVVDAEAKTAEESPAKAASSAIVSTYPRPEDYLTVGFRIYCVSIIFYLLNFSKFDSFSFMKECYVLI